MDDTVQIRNTQAHDICGLKLLYADTFPDEDLFPVVQELLKLESSVLSLTADKGGKPIGHILFTLSNIQNSHTPLALLAPLCVTPDKQKQGIGSNLISMGFKHLKTSGTEHIYVLGDPTYYHRFGFKQEDSVMPPYTLPIEWKNAWQSVCIGNNNVQLKGPLILPKAWQKKSLWLP